MLCIAASWFARHSGQCAVTESSTLGVGRASTVLSSRRSLVRPARSWAWTAAPRCLSLRAPDALVATMCGSSREKPTALPVESGTFDGAVCVQVLEYVADVDAALAELHRALRPGGRAVVWDVDWATVSIHSRDSALTERVLRAWDEHLADPSLPRTLGARLRSAGFEDVRVEAHAFAASGGDPERFGAALVPMIATFVAGRQGLGKVEAERVGRGAARADGRRRLLLRQHAVLLHSHEIRLAAPAGRSPRRACINRRCPLRGRDPSRDQAPPS